MPTFASLPLLKNSGGEPAQGIVVLQVTAPFTAEDGSRITMAASVGKIVGGVLLASNGTPLFVPVTPDGVAVELWMKIDESNGSTSSTEDVQWTIAVPNVVTLAIDNLVHLEPAGLNPDYVIPAMVQALLDSATASASAASTSAGSASTSATNAETARAAAVVAKNAAEAVPTTTDGIITSLDGNPASAFRVQSDARLFATYVRKGDIVVNPKDFGAVGDGVTDDLAAFQAMFTSLGTAGGDVVIPGDHFILSDSLNIDCEWVRVTCSPDTLIESTNVSTSSGGHVIAFVGYVGLGTATTPQRGYAEWNGGRIKTSISGDNENALGALRYKQVVINNLTVPVAGRKAFTAQYGVDNIRVDGLNIGQTGNAAVSIEESCNRVSLKNVHVTSAGRWGLYLVNVSNVTVENFVVDASGTSSVYSGNQDPSLYAGNVAGLSVKGFTSKGSVGHGISLSTVSGLCNISEYDLSGIGSGFTGVYASLGTGSLSLSKAKTSGSRSFLIAGSTWLKVSTEDITASNVPAGQDMFSFSALTTRPVMRALKGIGTTHRYTVDAVSMSGFEPSVSGCDFPMGTSGKFGNWKAKLETITSSLSQTATKDFPSIASGTYADMTFTIAGVSIGDLVIATPMTTIEAGLLWSVFVSASDIVTLRLGNTSAATVDPASRQWKVTVLIPNNI